MKFADILFLVRNPWVRLFFTIPLMAGGIAIAITRWPSVGLSLFALPFAVALFDVIFGRRLAAHLDRKRPCE